MLETSTFQRPDGPGTSTSMATRTAFYRWAMSGAWRRQKSLMVRLRSAAKSARSWRMSPSRAAACLSSSSCSCPCVVGCVVREPERRLGPDAMPCRVRLVRHWRARCQGVIAEDCRLEPLPALRGSPSAGSVPAGESCRRPTTSARASCAAWRCSNTLSKAATGLDP